MKTSILKGRIEGVLSRVEMKNIMAGGSPTNCILCEGGTMYCTTFNGMPPGPGCSWGHCPCRDEIAIDN